MLRGFLNKRRHFLGMRLVDGVAGPLHLYLVAVRAFGAQAFQVGLMVLSSFATRYQLGFSFQAGLVMGVVNTLAAVSICACAMNWPARAAGRQRNLPGSWQDRERRNRPVS